MKALIVETEGKYAAALTDDGQFIKIKNDNYSIGITIDVKEEKRINKKIISIYAASIAAAAMLLVVIGFKDFNTPYGIVSIDVNPSVTININRYDRVLEIEAVNDDAKEIVEQLNDAGLKYTKIDEVTDIILDQFEKGDYEAEDGTTFVVLSASSKDENYSEQLAERLETVSSEHEDINAQVIVADDELLERAREAGTTAGKMYLVDQLKSAHGEKVLDENEWLDKPVKEIVREINEQNNSNSPENMQNSPMTKTDESEIPPLENGDRTENANNVQMDGNNMIPQEGDMHGNEKLLDEMPGQGAEPVRKDEANKPGVP